MEYEIRSLLKTGIDANAFVSIDEFKGELPDVNYIKGAIQWSIGNVTILNDSNWDIVDLLWFFILDGILELRQKEAVEVYFPSQPLSLWISTIGPSQVRIKLNNFTTVVDRTLMIRSLCEGARFFFSRMSELASELKSKWDDGLQKIDKIESMYLSQS